MVDRPRNRQEIDFARSAAERLAFELLSARPIKRTYQPASVNIDELIGRVAEFTREFLGGRYLEPHRNALSFFDGEINDVRDLLDRTGRDILVLIEDGNAFGLDVVVDLKNARARRGIVGLSRPRSIQDGDQDVSAPPPPPPPLSANWLQSVDLGAAPVRYVPREQAARNFMTLFIDAFRMAASAGTAGSGAPLYVANANRRGWFLECWPQFHYSPKRFGRVTTWPVQDTLPASGDYMFQGLKGAQVSRDPSPHYFGPTRTSTIVKL